MTLRRGTDACLTGGGTCRDHSRRWDAEPCLRGALGVLHPGAELAPLDALVATATDATLVAGTRYPTAGEVARAWTTRQGSEHIRYFRGNQQNGIITFQDEDIEDQLRRLAD